MLRHLSLSGKGLIVDVASNDRHSCSAEDIQGVRTYLDTQSKGDKRYLPRRSGDEKLQVITLRE